MLSFSSSVGFVRAVNVAFFETQCNIFYSSFLEVMRTAILCVM